MRQIITIEYIINAAFKIMCRVVFFVINRDDLSVDISSTDFFSYVENLEFILFVFIFERFILRAFFFY